MDTSSMDFDFNRLLKPSSALSSTAPAAVGATSTRTRLATPSRRRRIIYETARRVTRQYTIDAIDGFIFATQASNVIQHTWRKFQSNTKLKEALININGMVSMYKARLQLQQLRLERDSFASRIITSFLKRWRRAQNISASITIQKHWRGLVTRNKVQEYSLTLLERECSAIVIQSFVRTFVAKMAFARRHDSPSASLIQQSFRHYLVRKRRRKAKQKLNTVCLIQKWWRLTMVTNRLIGYALAVMKESIISDDYSHRNQRDECNPDERGLIEANDFNENRSVSSNNAILTSFEDIKDFQNDCNELSGIGDIYGESNVSLHSSIDGAQDSDITNQEASCDSDDTLSITTMSSVSNTVLGQSFKDALELEIRQNQATRLIQCRLQTYMQHLHLVKEARRQAERRHYLLGQATRTVLSHRLWYLYQNFSQRRLEMKESRENQAAIVIQCQIRTFLATRFVSFTLVSFIIALVA